MGYGLNLVEQEALNLMLGQAGFTLIEPGASYTGQWTALRLVLTKGVTVNEVSLDALDEQWCVGDYFYGNITSIVNNSSYTILAYTSGKKDITSV